MKENTLSAETGTAQASRLSTLTRYYVRTACEHTSTGWFKLSEFKTLKEAEDYLKDCIRGNGLMILEKPIKTKYQIIKSVSEREVLKTWEGMVR